MDIPTQSKLVSNFILLSSSNFFSCIIVIISSSFIMCEVLPVSLFWWLWAALGPG